MADSFGALTSGRPVHVLRLGRSPGVLIELLTYGATIHRIEAPAPGGQRRNVVLGYPGLAGYLTGTGYLGASIGRYANRISGGTFELDGAAYQVATNDRGHNLHGGPKGFDRQVWDVVEQATGHALLQYLSPDGDQGFPGQLTTRARFSVRGTVVRVEYSAATTAPTLVNLTNHSYWNLDGESAGPIGEHTLQIPADQYTPVDGTAAPLGEHQSVTGTPFDLREQVSLGAVLGSDHPQLRAAGGLDHNFPVPGEGLRELARLSSPDGLHLTVRSDQPGIQVYTGNHFDGTEPGTSGVPYQRSAGVALEPQHCPDSPHHPQWPSVVLRPGQTYRTVTEFELSL
jgi:galactose mutarotase-like enzyme